MRSRRIRRADRVYEGRAVIFEVRRQRTQRRMQSKESVEIDRTALGARTRHRNRRPRRVIRLLTIRDDDIQPVHRAALKDCHQRLAPLRRRSAGHLHEHIRKEAAADESKARGFEEDASVDHFGSPGYALSGVIGYRLSVRAIRDPANARSAINRQPTTRAKRAVITASETPASRESARPPSAVACCPTDLRPVLCAQRSSQRSAI